MNRCTLFFLFFSLSFNSASAVAAVVCDVDLQYAFIVDERRIRIVGDSITQYQINGDDQLIVGGHWIELNEQQQSDVKLLSDGLHDIVPNMVVLAGQGIDLAISTVEKVVVGLEGDEHTDVQALSDALKQVHKKVQKKFILANGNYYIGPGSLENVDDFVDKELEEEIESAVNTSLSSIFSTISRLVSASNLDMDAQIDALTGRIERIGTDLARDVVPKANSLRERAGVLCQGIDQLNAAEDRLRLSIPELQNIDVIVVDKSAVQTTM